MVQEDGTHGNNKGFHFKNKTKGIGRVRLAYQPPASSNFLSEQTTTSNQPTVLFSQNKSAPAISHQPNEQAHSF
jgi:hypothetical protein